VKPRCAGSWRRVFSQGEAVAAVEREGDRFGAALDRPRRRRRIDRERLRRGAGVREAQHVVGAVPRQQQPVGRPGRGAGGRRADDDVVGGLQVGQAGAEGAELGVEAADGAGRAERLRELDGRRVLRGGDAGQQRQREPTELRLHVRVGSGRAGARG